MALITLVLFHILLHIVPISSLVQPISAFATLVKPILAFSSIVQPLLKKIDWVALLITDPPPTSSTTLYEKRRRKQISRKQRKTKKSIKFIHETQLCNSRISEMLILCDGKKHRKNSWQKKMFAQYNTFLGYLITGS